MKKPKEIIDIEIKWNAFFPLPGYFAMTFFGKMLIKNSDKSRWQRYVKNGQADVVTNHEMIHVKQAVSTDNSWWKFYWKYICQYLKNNPLFNGFKFAYKMNPFEIEAYANETDLFYNSKHSTGAVRWQKYKKLSVKERKNRWKQFQEKQRTEFLTFGKYINTYIDAEMKFVE